MRIIFLIVLMSMARWTHADASLPDTKAGHAAAAWLSAFNADDPKPIEQFIKEYGWQMDPEHIRSFREFTGGFTLLRVERSDSREITLLLKEKESERAAELKMSLTQEGGQDKVAIDIRPTPLPSEFAIHRLSMEDALREVTRATNQRAQSDQFSGAVLIARNDQVLLNQAWGLADRDTKEPNSTDTQFRMGSMNKMFTAVAVLQLVERGKLSLDKSVGTYLPDYPNKDLANKVTIRHLLTHTGGTGDIFGPEFDANRLWLRTHADYLRLFGSRGLSHEPGSQERYSNYGYVLLGAIIEKVSGMSYYDYVDKNIYAVAGMKSTGSLPESTEVPARAIGYTKQDGRWVPNTDTLPYRGMAAGGGYSTTGDLLRFVSALQSGKLLSKELLAQALRPQNLSGNYGYGFAVASQGALMNHGHGGGAPGMNGELRFYPQLGVVVVALSNLDPPAATRVADYFEARMPLQ